jgi:LPS export ABC transporter protein LptC
VTRWLAGAVLLLFALATAWLTGRFDEEPPRGQSEGEAVDFYMTDFLTTEMSEAGVRERELRAERMVHYADSDTQELSAPRLCVDLDQPEPWCVVSERGWVSSDRTTLRLLGDVHLWQQDGAGARLIDVYTRDVTVHTRREEAHTEAPARIVGRWGEVTGTGMVARLPKRQIELLSEVKTRYENRRP